MKDKLLDIITNPNDKLICVDMDGVLCHGEFWGGADPEPDETTIEFFNNLYKSGAHIIIFTARKPDWYPTTHAWLVKYGVMFHGIAMQMKPGADLYIDDKALNLEDVIHAKV